jgi:hypothetical protein
MNTLAIIAIAAVVVLAAAYGYAWVQGRVLRALMPLPPSEPPEPAADDLRSYMHLRAIARAETIAALWPLALPWLGVRWLMARGRQHGIAAGDRADVRRALAGRSTP